MANYRDRYTRRKKLSSREPVFKLDLKGLIRLAIVFGAIVAAIFIIANLVVQSNVASSYMAKAETIKVGVRTDIKGFGEVSGSGAIQGFDADVARQVITRVFGETKPVSFVQISSEEAGAGIKYGTIDCAIGFLTPKTERVSGFLVTDPYYTDHISVVSASAGIAKAITDLDQKNIGILGTSLSSTQVTDYLKQQKVTVQITKYYGFDEAKLDLDKNKISAFIAPQALIKQYMGSYITVGESLGSVGYSIMLPSTEGAVQSAMNKAIHEMISDNTLANLAVKWGISYNK